MYTNNELKTIFEQPYDRTIWLNVLRDNLGVQTIYKNPKGIPIKDNELAEEYIPLGELTTSEGSLIGIYEVPVSSKVKLQYNKVGLRSLLKKIYEADVDAAFVAFYQKEKWRFSYISEISTMQDGKRVKKATDPKRFTYLMGQGERCKTAADRFAGIRSAKDLFGSGVTLKALEEAFNVEKMSKAFFDEYRKHYGKFTGYLTGKDENSKETGKPPPASFHQTFKGEHKEKHARDFIKKLMGRIVFLYFLQKKGWLGVPENEAYGKGDEDFLSKLFNDCKHKEAFYPLVLVPLFFDTLNCERKGDLFKIDATQFAKSGYNKVKIPYLNGGLFDNSEEHTDGLLFPKELFAALFTFFDQYNFTVYEDSPDEHTVAVDPEMLGHIFENLLEDNKDKGAFYTPKEIVHYMCQESLIEYLYTQLNPQQTETHLELGKKQTDMFGNTGKKGQLALTQPVATNKEQVSRELLEALVKRSDASNLTDWDEAILKALRDVKICDPAIGSGAFPMGLLMEIFHLVETLHDFSPDVTEDVWKLDGEWNAAKVKEQIIQNSIYGVDIEKGAVDIARLRFWLSLVVDEETPKPLPNLDYKIVVGNSLLSKFEDEVIDIEWIDGVSIDTADKKRMKLQEALDELADKQRKFFDAKGNKQKLQKDIRNLKIDILKGELQLARDKFVKNTAFTGSMYGLTEKEKIKVAENKIRIGSFDSAIEKLNAIQKDEKQPLEFFDWKLDFSEVMNKKVNKKEEGFDIVIGNPPYIQLQKLGEYADELQKRNFKTFALLVIFIVFFMKLGSAFLNRIAC